MSQWYCTYCNKHVYANEQDHADYEREMCQDCVDNEKEQQHAWWQSLDTDDEWINANK